MKTKSRYRIINPEFEVFHVERYNEGKDRWERQSHYANRYSSRWVDYFISLSDAKDALKRMKETERWSEERARERENWRPMEPKYY